MGFPVRAVFAVLWTTQLIALGLVGVSVYQQHLLLENFRTISESDSTGRNREGTAKSVAPGGEPIHPGTVRPAFEKPVGAEKMGYYLLRGFTSVIIFFNRTEKR